MAKKALEGIFLSKNSKGFYISIKQNQHKLATLGGYNTRANAMKGLLALNKMLNGHFDKVNNKYEGIIDLTKMPKKKAAPKKTDPYKGLPVPKNWMAHTKKNTPIWGKPSKPAKKAAKKK